MLARIAIHILHETHIKYKSRSRIRIIIHLYIEGVCLIFSTDIDIISSSIGPQNLCIVYILRTGGGRPGLQKMFDLVNGESPANEILAEMLYKQAEELKII